MTKKQPKKISKPRRGWAGRAERGWKVRVDGAAVDLITPSNSVWTRVYYSEPHKARAGADLLCRATGLPLEVR